MLTIQNYVRAESLEQAYELNQKKSARIIGGMLWLKMTHIRVQNAIDLSGLGLDTIEETPDMYRIGCMTTLRSLELHPGRAVVIREPHFGSAGTFSEEDVRAFANDVSQNITTGSNMRAQAAYRTHLAEVLTRRSLLTLKGGSL